MATRMDVLRRIVAECQAAKVQWVDGNGKSRKLLVDLFTASAAVRFHDALSEANRAKWLAMPWPAAVEAMWRIITRAKAAS